MIFVLPTDTCFGIGCEVANSSDYERLYEIKKRPKSKLLAVMVQNFSDLERYTNLTSQQIGFVKNYERPFTVLSESTLDLSHISNGGDYGKIAFRVANMEVQKNLIEKVWPIFLTSANESGESENYDLSDIKDDFSEYSKLKYFEKYQRLEWLSPSDIFEFESDSLDIKFLRKIRK